MLILPVFFVLSQSAVNDASSAGKSLAVADPAEERRLLEEELKKLNEQIAQYEKDISKTGSEKKTLQNQIYLLRQQVESIDLKIKQSNVIIKDLGIQIVDTESSIVKTSAEVENSKDKLAKILRTIYKEDQRSSVEILLSEDRLSDFFSHLAALETLNIKNQELLSNIESLKNTLEVQRDSLDQEKGDLEGVVKVQLIQKNESENLKEDKAYFLQLTEAQYQKYLKEKEITEKKAAEIRSKIYELIGVREAVTYAQALEIVKYAAGQAGVRPALVLGILSQESSIGRNVGQCHLTNTKTGAGTIASSGKSIARVMNPTRDVPPFIEIINEINKNNGLTLDYKKTLVSCPMSVGWGGAMGPAQFIPSTWIGYQKKVQAITGMAADPWDLRDASLASGLYLKDNINRFGTEGKAVQSYFCGSPKGGWCQTYEKSVLYLASCHQTFIDEGSMSAACQRSIGLKI